MHSGPHGLPHKEVKQLPVKTRRKETDINMWVSNWEGQGLISDVYIEAESWWTTDQIWFLGNIVAQPTLVMEFKEPINLTHVFLWSDTAFVETWGIHAPFYCEYSKDGVNWSRLGYPAIGNAYYERTGAPYELPCYFWVPRTKIKAKYWRLVVHSEFNSSYNDLTWHITECHPGTLDYIKDDIIYDASLFRTGDDPDPYWTIAESGYDNYEDIQKWVGAGKLHRTGIQLDIMFITRSEDTYNNLINTRYFWMDLESVKYFTKKGDHEDDYNMAMPFLLHNGFISNISTQGRNVWDAAHQFVTVSLYRDGYLGWGWANNIHKGVACSRSWKADDKTIQNTLGEVPDCVWLLYNGTQYGLTHPLYPYKIYPCTTAYNMYADVVSMDSKEIELTSGWGQEYSGAIFFRASANFFQGGEYTGDGTTNRFISTPNINPKLLIVKRIPNGSVGTFMLITSLDSDEGDTWELSGFNDKLDYNEGIVVSETGFTLQDGAENKNASGEDYLWWAWA